MLELTPVSVYVPQEVIDAIVGESADDQATLAAWCLVSRRLCESAGPVLYAEVRLTERNWKACLSKSCQEQFPTGTAETARPAFTCSRLAHALSFSSLRHLSIPVSVLPLLDLSKICKLADAMRRRLSSNLTLTVLDPTGSALKTFCAHAGPLMALLNPSRVVFNLEPILDGTQEPPIGLLDVIEGEILRDFKRALVAAAVSETATESHAAERESDPPAIIDEAYPDDDAPLACSVLLQLACASDAHRLAAEERLIRQLKTCLRVLTLAPAFATDDRLIRAFFADVEPCEAAFERRFVDVPFGRTGWLRVARPQTLDRTAGCRSTMDWWMTRLGQPPLLDL